MSFVEPRRSLATRLVAWFALAATALLVLAASLLYVALEHGVVWRDDQVLMKRAGTIRDLIKAESIDFDYLDHEVSEDLEGPRQLFIRIAGSDKIGLHETPLAPEGLNFDRFPAPRAGAFDVFQFGDVSDKDGHKFRVVSLKTHAATGSPVMIQMALDTSLDASVLDQYAELAVFVVLGGLILSVAAGLWIVRAQLAPLTQLSSQVMKIQHSTLDKRVPLDGLPSEIAEFATQFNRMIARLEKAYVDLKRYADDVAHELRTPLGRIQLEAELALRTARTPADYRKALGSTLEDCEHLTSMVKALLFIARAENGRAEIQNEHLNLAERLDLIRSFFEDSASEAGVKLTLSCDPTLSVDADPMLLQRAVSNLVANSLAHTPHGGQVSLAASAETDGVVIEVADTGEGIAPEHQPFVFDRFFRGDAARKTDKDRVGLGLAITKSIVDLHHGRITLESTPANGTRFSLHFPAA